MDGAGREMGPGRNEWLGELITWMDGALYEWDGAPYDWDGAL